MQRVKLFTDGAARNNPGRGGFGSIVQFTDSNGGLHEKIIAAGFDKTTNNRMELLGVIKGLEVLNRPCHVDLYSDSKYVTDAISKGWIGNWVKSNWRTSAKKPVANKEMWQRLMVLLSRHEVEVHWVKGHAGHIENERCDKLATTSADGDTLLHDDGSSLVNVC